MRKYKTIIVILSAIILVQGVILLRSCQGPQGQKKKTAKISLPVRKEKKAKIAIVIDDWGYNLNNFSVLKEINFPITLSVLPNLSYSKKIAQEAHILGLEIILHLPMEPFEKFRLERDTIMTSMKEKEIKTILSKDIDSLVWANGVSNHMGSAATRDVRVMTIVFNELKAKKLFFLDSFVSANSVCPLLAEKIGIGFAKRDIFLDNVLDPRYIRKQIYKLKFKARKNGHAIGIGHDRKITLQVLKEIVPELEKEGYEFVFVSELVN